MSSRVSRPTSQRTPDPAVGEPGARRRHAVLVLLAACLWGTSGIVGAAAMDHGVPALSVSVARLGVAALVLSPLTVALLRTRPDRGTLLRLFAAGGLLASYQASFFAAVGAAGVTVATLVALGAAPVLTAVGGPWVGDPRPGARTWTAVATGLGGLVLLTGGPGTSGPSPVLGMGLALVSASGFAAMTLLGRTLTTDPLRTAAAGSAVGAVVLAPFLPGLAVVLDAPQELAALLYLGVVPTALAYSLFFRGVTGVTAATASILTLVEPVTAAGWAWALRDEQLSTLGAVGAFAVLAAAALALVRPSRPAE